MNTKLIALLIVALSLGAGATSAQETDRDTELEQARQQLEEAARRIAELTTSGVELAGDFVRWAGGGPPRAVLGVGIEDDDQGVRVVGVTPGGGADEAGVETGDIITAMDGAALGVDNGSPSEVLIAQMRNVDPGDTVTLTVLRDGESRELDVAAAAPRWGNATMRGVPGGMRGDGAAAAGHRFRPFDMPMRVHAWADMELVELTPGLGAYFGTETGVLVVRAPRDDTLGLQDGDVILEIGGREPVGVGHALRILASFEPGEPLELTIMREQSRRTLEVEFAADSD
jgi:S1-C subfamily serine protease